MAPHRLQARARWRVSSQHARTIERTELINQQVRHAGRERTPGGPGRPCSVALHRLGGSHRVPLHDLQPFLFSAAPDISTPSSFSFFPSTHPLTSHFLPLPLPLRLLSALSSLASCCCSLASHLLSRNTTAGNGIQIAEELLLLDDSCRAISRELQPVSLLARSLESLSARHLGVRCRGDSWRLGRAPTTAARWLPVQRQDH